MQPGDEIELKWMLDAEHYSRCATALERSLGAGRPLTQRNQFYDTPDGRLRAAKVNLRLRQENGCWIATCKQRVSAAGGLHHHLEWESLLQDSGDPLDLALALDLPPALREALGGVRPICLGGFTNQRLAWDRDDEHICLDRTDFATRIDHELEVETHDVATSRARWSQRFAAWKIVVQPSLTTKFARFLATLPAS